jgi:hypothetical protein
LILVLFSGAAWIGVQNLGYTEFRAARRLLFAGAFQNLVNAQLALRRLEESLGMARTTEERWRAVESAAGGFGFERVELYLDGAHYLRQAAGPNGHVCWELRVPLGGDDRVYLARAFQCPLPPAAVEQFAEALRAGLSGTRTAAAEPAAKKPIAVAVSASARSETYLPYSLPR